MKHPLNIEISEEDLRTMSLVNIGKKYGCSETYARSQRINKNITSKQGRTRIPIDIDDLHTMNTRELVEKYKCTPSTITFFKKRNMYKCLITNEHREMLLDILRTSDDNRACNLVEVFE